MKPTTAYTFISPNRKFFSAALFLTMGGMLHPTARRRRTRRMKDVKSANAFTLVELLVVISIIAVLAALLMVSVKKITQTSQRAACASNMRQVGAALYLYAGDHNGELPYCWAGGVGPQKLNNVVCNWDRSKVASDLAPYVDDKVWDCPDPLVRANRLLPASFGVVWTKNSYKNPYKPVDQQTDWDAPLTTGSALENRNAHRLLEYPKPSLATVFYCSYTHVNGSGVTGVWPHGGTINQLYLDGHVEFYRPTYHD